MADNDNNKSNYTSADSITASILSNSLAIYSTPEMLIFIDVFDTPSDCDKLHFYKFFTFNDVCIRRLTSRENEEQKTEIMSDNKKA